MQPLVTVFGGSGFVGSQIVRALTVRGYRVRVAVRRPALAARIARLGDVGQVELVQANLRDEASVRRALAGASAAVNATGVLYSAGRQSFAGLHVEGPALIARLAAELGLSDLVHLSAIGADAHSASAYGRSKAEGEAAVRAAFPAAVILRPSVIFGPEDDFFNRFGKMAMISPALPLIGGGETRFQPVYVHDVAEAAARALGDAAARGRTFELGGPEIETFRALMERLLAEIERRRALVPVPFPIAGLLGLGGDIIAMTGLLAPPLTRDQVEMLRVDNVVGEGVGTLADFGVTPTAMDAVLPTYLYRYRKGGKYAEINRSGG
jgi:uncharacterized protein YbjT (DUF2867 family)